MTKPTVRNIKLKLGMDLSSGVTMYRSLSALSIRCVTICFKDVQVKLILYGRPRVLDDLIVYYRRKTVYRRYGSVDLDELCFEPWWLELKHLLE